MTTLPPLHVWTIVKRGDGKKIRAQCLGCKWHSRWHASSDKAEALAAAHTRKHHPPAPQQKRHIKSLEAIRNGPQSPGIRIGFESTRSTLIVGGDRAITTTRGAVIARELTIFDTILMCARCEETPVLYEGTIYCGAACQARAESEAIAALI